VRRVVATTGRAGPPASRERLTAMIERLSEREGAVGAAGSRERVPEEPRARRRDTESVGELASAGEEERADPAEAGERAPAADRPSWDRDEDAVEAEGTPRHAAAPPASASSAASRWLPSRRAAWAVLVLAALAVALVLLFPPSCGARPEVSVLVSGSASPLPDGLPSGPASSAEAGEGGDVVAHVTGAVRRPGLVRLPGGALVDDAVREAGGLSEDAAAEGVNLAAEVERGQQVRIPTREEAAAAPAAAGPAPGSSGSPASGGSSAGGSVGAAGPDGAGKVPAASGAAGGAAAGSAEGRVNLNTATAAELQTLPRVGPVLSERIVDWREQNGPFASVQELDAVPGIGDAMMASLEPLVTV
jgi:competence protein ComEA